MRHIFLTIAKDCAVFTVPLASLASMHQCILFLGNNVPKRKKRSQPCASRTKEPLSQSEHKKILKQAYASVDKHLIGLTQFLRIPEKHPIRKKSGGINRTMRTLKTHKDLVTLLDACKDWCKRPAASGHVTYINRVTHIKVCAIPHAGDMKPGVKQNLLQQIQKHINILGNEIFGYGVNNWAIEPDYKQAVMQDQKRRASLRKESKPRASDVPPGPKPKRFRR